MAWCGVALTRDDGDGVDDGDGERAELGDGDGVVCGCEKFGDLGEVAHAAK